MLRPSAISSAMYFEVSCIASYWEERAMWVLSLIKEFPPMARTDRDFMGYLILVIKLLDN
jgi:hypothetical protein